MGYRILAMLALIAFLGTQAEYAWASSGESGHGESKSSKSGGSGGKSKKQSPADAFGIGGSGEAFVELPPMLIQTTKTPGRRMLALELTLAFHEKKVYEKYKEVEPRIIDFILNNLREREAKELENGSNIDLVKSVVQSAAAAENITMKTKDILIRRLILH